MLPRLKSVFIKLFQTKDQFMDHLTSQHPEKPLADFNSIIQTLQALLKNVFMGETFFFLTSIKTCWKLFFFMYRDLLKKCIFSCVKASENMFSWVKLFFSYIETFYKLFFFINWALLKCFFFFMYWNPDWFNFYYAKNTPMTNKDSKKRPLCAVRLTLHPDYSAF